jgi:hypothetical protein
MTARKEKPDMQLAPLEGTVEESRAMTAPTPDNLLAMALSRGADMEQLERLMALKERHDANEARKAYVAAMAAFKAEAVEILKRKRVTFENRDGTTTSYSHAELYDAVEAAGPALAKHGLAWRWDIKQDGGAIIVTCILTHALGHSESVTMQAGKDESGKKNAIQQVASTNTYLQRYTFLAITGLATKGQDDDGAAFDKSDGDDEAGGLAEATLVDWETAIGECENNAQLAGMRKDMIAKLGDGDIEKVPQRLRSAVLRRAEQLAKVE